MEALDEGYQNYRKDTVPSTVDHQLKIGAMCRLSSGRQGGIRPNLALACLSQPRFPKAKVTYTLDYYCTVFALSPVMFVCA